MSSEIQYNDIIRRIRVIRARLLMKFVNNESLLMSFSNILDRIGKDADMLHSEGKLLDDVSDRLERFEDELLVR